MSLTHVSWVEEAAFLLRGGRERRTEASSIGRRNLSSAFPSSDAPSIGIDSHAVAVERSALRRAWAGLEASGATVASASASAAESARGVGGGVCPRDRRVERTLSGALSALPHATSPPRAAMRGPTGRSGGAIVRRSSTPQPRPTRHRRAVRASSRSARSVERRIRSAFYDDLHLLRDRGEPDCRALHVNCAGRGAGPRSIPLVTPAGHDVPLVDDALGHRRGAVFAEELHRRGVRRRAPPAQPPRRAQQERPVADVDAARRLPRE